MKTQRYSKKSPGRGGARPGAGRKPGSTNRIRIEDLLKDIETATAMPYSERLALNYAQAVDRSDWARVENYDKAFLNKIVADKLDVELSDDADTVTAKRTAFAAALAAVAGIAPQDK